MTATTTSWPSLIPAERLDAVEAALRASFGTTAVERAERLTGGYSGASVLKIHVRGRAYLLRLSGPVDAFNDPARQYRCMTLAADAGIAPRVHHADAATGVAVTGFVDARPLHEWLNGTTRERALEELTGVVRAIQALPLFPPLVDFLDGIDTIIAGVRAGGALERVPLHEHLERYAVVQAVYPRRAPDLASSHNDLNPRNILHDGERLWVVDWDAAFANDPYVDLAIVTRGFARDDAEEAHALHAFFGGAPGEERWSRYFLMKQVCRFYYGMLFLSMAAPAVIAGSVADPGPDAPSGVQAHAMIGAGRLDLDTAHGRLVYARSFLNDALRDMRTERFERAVAVIAGA